WTPLTTSWRLMDSGTIEPRMNARKTPCASVNTSEATRKFLRKPFSCPRLRVAVQCAAIRAAMNTESTRFSNQKRASIVPGDQPPRDHPETGTAFGPPARKKREERLMSPGTMLALFWFENLVLSVFITARI